MMMRVNEAPYNTHTHTVRVHGEQQPVTHLWQKAVVKYNWLYSTSFGADGAALVLFLLCDDRRSDSFIKPWLKGPFEICLSGEWERS